ncbi:MAG: hypothetical protein HKO53_04010 [Gemmatimonadetes bacterium]|nr:hypothetical protein [Gemmatimonadota bacterium]
MFVALAGAAGCSGGPEEGPAPGRNAAEAAPSCPPEGDGIAAEALSTLEGDYQLTVQSSEGAVARGQLTLQALSPSDAEAPTVPGMADTVPGRALSWGWTDLDAGAVGAFSPGDLDSRNPERPGVLLLVSPTAGEGSSLILRLGAQVNDRSRTDFDGGHFALRVEWSRADSSFGGTWTSRGRGQRASGSFCAVAVP